ncbi:hypothetical protein GKZ90_0022050 [Flavobacterium sp. MC2016-06]|jgi:hypothetical protein|uniref:hypothetical protein n=1 Tax=Flavobacterium sp. MC2016-06 TaxID=2676308 RepID=UPI0012BAA315|nr:hypothetical protein [Flavobacterium sp. MC2016-06]MBU3861110.1 hypothetical protein [Flavobacterium sp. MC2016-06]
MTKYFIMISILSLFSCKPKTEESLIEKENKVVNQEQHPLTTLEEATKYVEENFTKNEETLWISDYLNDSVGVNMAIITDHILGKNYMPDSFEQKEGYRIYKYKK